MHRISSEDFGFRQILREKFRLKINSKSKNTTVSNPYYETTLTMKSVTLKPADIALAKIRTISGDSILSCVKSGKCSMKIIALDKVYKNKVEFHTYEMQILKSNDDSISDEYLSSVIEEWISKINENFALRTLQKEEQFLFVINPNSGKGKALKFFESLQKLIEVTGLPSDQLITEAKNHARNYLTNGEQNDNTTGVIVISGDGSLHEVINGIYYSSDGKEKMDKTLLSVLPQGSGNAFNRSLIHLQRERFKRKGLESAIRRIFKDKSQRMDLFEINFLENQQNLEEISRERQDFEEISKIEENSTKNLIGFLSVGWGIFADADINSEPYRWLGGIRFSIWGVYYILRKRAYTGILSYLPADTPEIENSDQDLPPGWVTEGEKSYMGIIIMNLPFADETSNFAPYSRPDDGCLWIITVDHSATRLNMLKMFGEVEKGRMAKVDGCDIKTVKAFRLIPTPRKAEIQSNNSKKNLTVDGETIPYGPIEAKVLPKACKVMCN